MAAEPMEFGFAKGLQPIAWEKVYDIISVIGVVWGRQMVCCFIELEIRHHTL